MENKRILVVGAGLSGAVIARELAEAGFRIEIIDKRDHPAGNCHSRRDSQTGVMVHCYGAHIFHTDDREVWDYVRSFGDMVPYVNRVKACAAGQIYSLPINLLTINQFFGVQLSPDQARAYLGKRTRRSDSPPANFEEQALAMVGPELYETFFRGYTLKQWGMAPGELSASVLKRLPVRFNYDDNYFPHRFQGIPKEGYTELVGRILGHPRISTCLGTPMAAVNRREYFHVFYSGELDGYFEYRLGRLKYRTLRFECFYPSVQQTLAGDYQGCAVMNYCDADVPYTRIVEHKHFAPWEQHEQTVCCREYSLERKADDIPYYPVRLATADSPLAEYISLAKKERGVTFIGRLGTFRYLDMDAAVREALDTAKGFIQVAGDTTVHMPFLASVQEARPDSE